MIKQSIFREYDIRGIYKKELHEQSVKLIGYFLGIKIKGEKIVAVGYDARTHSTTLRDYLISGLNAAKCTVLDMGLVATPVNYFSNYHTFNGLTPDASIMITGSHNPKEYNGFKVTSEKLPFFGKSLEILGQTIVQNSSKIIPNNLTKIDINVKAPYIDFMLKEFKHLKKFPQKIAIDCGNGVAGTVIEDIFKGLEFNYYGLYCTPDGTFPNHHPNPSVEKNLVDIKNVLATHADIAFAYDGDADRLAVLTPNYNIKGDQMALLYEKMIPNATIIGEVKCSQVMYDVLEQRGVKTIMYKTGHSNLKMKMKESSADLACEVSGHVFFKHRYFGFDDAIYATLRMIELIHFGIDLEHEIEILPQVFSTEEIEIKTTDEEKFDLIHKIKSLLKNPPEGFPKIMHIIDIDGLRIHFEHGWGLVRASNTTPTLVTRFESPDMHLMHYYQTKINELIVQVQTNT